MDKIKAAILPTIAGIALMLFWQKLDRMQSDIDTLNKLVATIQVVEYRISQYEKAIEDYSKRIATVERMAAKHEEIYTLKKP
jgi:hypothetical protein